MENQHDCSIHSEKLCCHSAESILLLLSKSPWPYTIKEISDLTNLHRNTIRESLRKLRDSGVINSLGVKNPSDKTKKQYGIDQYFYESTTDHYRSLARSLSNLDFTNPIKKEIATKIGFQLVKDRLEVIFSKLNLLDNFAESRFTHVNLEHALLHLKMAYPFSDLSLDVENRLILDTKFKIKSIDSSEENQENRFNLKLNPCLCNGQQEYYLACHMVEGALKGIIQSAIGMEADIEWDSTGHDSDGQFCAYTISTHGIHSKPNKIVPDDPILTLSQHRYLVI